MIHNLFLIVVVVFRALGFYCLASSLLGILVGLIVSRGINGGLQLVVMLLPLVGGILLWILAKPCATLITKDLE